MGWAVRNFDELTKDELYNILKVRVDIFVVEQTCPYPEIDNKDRLAYHLFKEMDGEIVAYARVFRSGDYYREASIGRVLVKEQYRKEGMGKELLERAISFTLEDLNETTIKIQAQDHLHKFYGSFGFKPISDVYLEDDIPHVDMLLQH